MEHGPVEVSLVVAFGDPKIDGSVLSELQRLASEGTSASSTPWWS